MPEQLANLLWQLPIVAVFLWYTMQRDKAENEIRRELLKTFNDSLTEERKSRESQAKSFDDALTEERKSREEQARSFVEALDEVKTTLGEYRKDFDKAVAVMQERTKSKQQ